MKAALLASSLLVLPLSSAMARGEFGAALGGSIIGGALGTIIGNSVSRPAPPPVYYQPAPVYVVPRYVAPPPRRVVVVPPAYAPAQPPDVDSVSYQQGSSDRDGWDNWFDKLGGQQKEGAAFWADQRSRPNPLQCRTHASYGNDWMDGCTSAQRRLSGTDDRRRTDAQYRDGWDKMMPETRSASIPPQSVTQAPVTPAPIAISAPAAPQEPAAPEVKETALTDVFSADMLNVEVPYFEKSVGPAKRIAKLVDDKTIRTYRVEGCDVKAHVQGTNIYAFGMDLTPSCNVSLKAFFPDLASTKNLTLGKFVKAEGEGSFHATCLTTCGKNDDADASYHWQGGRAANRVEVELVFPVKDGSADDAAQRLAKAMTDKDGADFVTTNAFNCNPKYDSLALDTYKNASVSEVVLGYGIEDEAGIYKASCQKTN